MKRKQHRSLFIWNESKRSKEDNSDTDCEVVSLGDKPQIELIMQKSDFYFRQQPLPYQLLIEIFQQVVTSSENPLADLCNIARVCESWRQMVLQTPCLWSRVNLTSLPMTDRNLATLNRIFQTCPSIIDNVKEVSFNGVASFKSTTGPLVVEKIMTAPNVNTLAIRQVVARNRHSLQTIVTRSLQKCKSLRSLSLTQAAVLFTNQKWFTDFLVESGTKLEVLNLSMSFVSIPAQIVRAVGSDYCPNLKVLDISTCDAILTHSIDAIQLAESMPNLEVLRVGNVSFKRVMAPPDVYKLTKLKELSMPIGTRDADRDDALLATLTFGSDKITTLDLRGSIISPNALLDMPSYNVRNLHIDDLCPIMRNRYDYVISKWANTLERLSLVKINSPDTMRDCLKALYKDGNVPKIKELDLSSSDIQGDDLRNFLKKAKHLDSINLSSCRSLPRGSKGEYFKVPRDKGAKGKFQKLSFLMTKLK